ncbi:unnamed protein product [Zymoseptoria tritici ST99CH_1A5]|uniref:Uncharacterized protein n=1 Tax=Zymoseptoria tritici ST99CH_1A5 TaxID=1276529 RepID=A0A1Y6LZM4_ZYMTR|nr:unnamed protein product [Zymoseptoria tritici ST99CH_1A5]
MWDLTGLQFFHSFLHEVSRDSTINNDTVYFEAFSQDTTNSDSTNSDTNTDTFSGKAFSEEEILEASRDIRRAMHDLLWNSSSFFFGGKQGGGEMKTCNKENQAPAGEISAFIDSNNRSITYPVLPALEPTATTTTANVPKPSIPDKSPARRHHPSTTSTVPPSASPTTTTTIPNRPPNAQPREPLFLPRNHHSHSHSTDIEILQSAGRQACLKRGHLIPATTPCNVGRPRVKLGFLTESPARKGWRDGVRGIFAEGGRRIGEEQVEMGGEVEDDEFEDAVVGLGGDGASSRKSKTRPGSDSMSVSEEEGGRAVQMADGVRSSESVVVSGGSSPRVARLPLSRRNVAMLDAAPPPTSIVQSPRFSPGPVSRVRGSSRFAPRLGDANTSAGPSASNSRSRYDTPNSAGSFSPSRMFDAPPRRNPARLTNAKEKPASKLSEVHVPTTTTTSVVSAFSKSSEEDEEETDSSTPAWTDDEIFLRRHERSRSSRKAEESASSAKVGEKVVGPSGTPVTDPIVVGEPKDAESKTAMCADGLALEMGSVAIRSKRKQRGKKVRTGAKLGGLQVDARQMAAERTLEGLALDQGGE